MKIISSTEQKTLLFAKKFSKQLAGGQVLGLIGDLGAGKTIFTKGLALGLGIKKNVTSPTFVLMKVYPVKLRAPRILPKTKLFSRTNPASKHGQIKFLVHIDAYRIKSVRDLTAIGANEYFNRPDAVTVIEWADKIKKVLPEKAKLIKIGINKTSRIIDY